MAQSSKTKTHVAELIYRSELARAKLSSSHAELKHKLDVPARIKESFLSTPVKWMGGFLLAGLAANFIFRSKKHKPTLMPVERKMQKSRGLISSLLFLCFSMLKPVAKMYALKIFKSYLGNRFEQGAIKFKNGRI